MESWFITIAVSLSLTMVAYGIMVYLVNKDR